MFCVLYLLAFLSFEKSWDPAFCFCMRFTSCHMLLFIFLRWLFRDTNMFFIFWRYPFTIKYMVRLQHKMVNVNWWMIYRKCKYKVEYKSNKTAFSYSRKYFNVQYDTPQNHTEPREIWWFLFVICSIMGSIMCCLLCHPIQLLVYKLDLLSVPFSLNEFVATLC